MKIPPGVPGPRAPAMHPESLLVRSVVGHTHLGSQRGLHGGGEAVFQPALEHRACRGGGQGILYSRPCCAQSHKKQVRLDRRAKAKA